MGDPESLTEEEKIALLGRPCLGTNSKIQIRIKESKEFKNSVDKIMQKANNSMMVGSSSWLEQFTDAFVVQAADEDEEEEEGEGDGEEKMPSCGDYIMHFLTLPWKLIFAFIPPTAIYAGYPTFVVSISAASSTSRTVSTPSPLSLSAPLFPTPSLPRRPPLRTRLPTPLWATWPEPTLSTSSWVLVSPGV